MTSENFRVLPLISAAMLALSLASCSAPHGEYGDGDTAIRDGVIIDDLREPYREDF